MKRKHISWKIRCASALLDAMMQRERFGPTTWIADKNHLYPQRWYDDAKQMTEDQFLSLFQWDHNILHSSEHEDRDKFWNLTPALIQAHREKTRTDAKVIAKSRRLRAKYMPNDLTEKGLIEIIKRLPRMNITKYKLRSRGFDKTLRKKINGKVEKR